MLPMRFQAKTPYIVVKVNGDLPGDNLSKLSVGDEVLLLRAHSRWSDVYARDEDGMRFPLRRNGPAGFGWVCVVSDSKLGEMFSFVSARGMGNSKIVLADPVNAPAILAGVPIEDIYC